MKVVVAISGGIDSAVTAILLKKEGYEVYGIHLRLTDEEVNTERIDYLRQTLQIPIEVFDGRKEFNNSVINYFKSEHLRGHTPSPCAVCNPSVKWKIIAQYANSISANHIATGHYIQKIKQAGKCYIKCGNDEVKDQSYYLWGLDQDILERMLCPLGTRTKVEVREIARINNLTPLTKIKESTGLCFAQNMGYAELINKYIPEANSIGEGNIVDINGQVIGKHKGHIYYTIGQKKDLTLFGDKNLYVLKINADNNELVAGPKELLWTKSFRVQDFLFTDLQGTITKKEISVKIRGFGWNPEGYCTIKLINHKTIHIELEQAAFAITPGQPAVFYEGDIVMGGGFVL